MLSEEDGPEEGEPLQINIETKNMNLQIMMIIYSLFMYKCGTVWNTADLLDSSAVLDYSQYQSSTNKLNIAGSTRRAV